MVNIKNIQNNIVIYLYISISKILEIGYLNA